MNFVVCSICGSKIDINDALIIKDGINTIYECFKNCNFNLNSRDEHLKYSNDKILSLSNKFNLNFNKIRPTEYRYVNHEKNVIFYVYEHNGCRYIWDSIQLIWKMERICKECEAVL